MVTSARFRETIARAIAGERTDEEIAVVVTELATGIIAENARFRVKIGRLQRILAKAETCAWCVSRDYARCPVADAKRYMHTKKRKR